MDIESKFPFRGQGQKLQQDHHKVAAKQQEESVQYLAGRGAQINTKNRFLKDEKTQEHIEAVDDWEASNLPTQYIATKQNHRK